MNNTLPQTMAESGLQHRLLARLLETSAALQSGRTRAEVLEVILRGVQQSGFDRVRLFLLTPDAQTLTGVAQSGMTPAQFHQVSWPVAEDFRFQQLLQNPQPQIFTDDPAQPDPNKERFDKPAQWAAFPLLREGRVIGQLVVDNKFTHRPIEPAELPPLALFAMQAAAALEKAELSEQLAQKAEQLEALRLTTLKLTAASVREQQSLLDQIVTSAARLLRARSAGLYQYHAERGHLELIADHNRPLQIGHLLKLGEGVAGRLVQRGDFYRIVADYQTDPERAASFGEQPLFGAVLEVVLRWQGEVVGVLYVDDEVGRAFSSSDIRLLSLFAEQAAVVLAHHKLSARDGRKLELFAKLAAATTEIVGQIGKRKLRELLDLVARHASEILVAEVCSVFLCKGTASLVLEAGYGYRAGTFQYGLALPIRSGSQSGFTGHVAAAGELVNLHGEQLRGHPAIRTHANQFSPSGHCYSVLALPLKQQQHDAPAKLVGLLRADNKLDPSGRAHQRLPFTPEDEGILRIFGEVVTVCLASAKLVEHQQLLIENLPQALIAIDLHGQVTEFNQEAERILGYQAHEIVGQRVSQLYFNPEEPKLIGAALDASVDGRLTGYVTQICTKAGQPVLISLSAYWLYEHQQRSGSVGIFQDLRQLNDAKQRLELTLSAIRTVAEAETLPAGLQGLAELLVARFPGSSCGVFLLNEQGSALLEQAAAGELCLLPRSAAVREIELDAFPGLAALLQAGKPVRLRYAGADPVTQAHMRKLSEEQGFAPPIQSLLVVPIKLGTRLLGALDLAELCPAEQSQFSREHLDNIQLAAAIATQSAIFIDRMLTAERARTRLISFYEVSSKLAARKDPPTLLEDLVKETCQAAGARCVDLVLIDQEGRPQTPISMPRRPLERPLHVRPNGLSAEVFRTGVALPIPDVRQARDRLNPELIQEAQAAICLPLALPQRRIGVLWLRYDQRHVFSAQEIAALQLYVNQAAMAYESAQEEDRQRRLRAAAEALTRATDLPSVRSLILQYARELLGAAAVIFGYYEHSSQAFVSRWSEADGLAAQEWEQYRELSAAPEATAQRLLELGPVFIGHLSETQEGQLLGKTTRALLTQMGVVSLWSLPVQAEGKPLGLIGALYRQPHSFDEREWRTATSFARYAGLALHKARLVEQTRRANEAATLVTKITVLGQRHATLAALVKEVQKVAEGDAVVLFEYDQEKDRLLPPFYSGLQHPERLLAEEPDSPLVRKLLAAAEPLMIENVVQHPEFRERQFARDEAVRSLLAISLRAAGKPVGVLFVNYRRLHYFTVEAVETVQLFANQAALAIHYAQTTEANQRKLRELEALERLSNQLRRAQTLQEMMDCATALAAQELGVEFCNIILPNRKGQLELRSQFGWAPPLEPFEVKAGVGSQAGFMIQTGQPVRVADYDTEDRFAVMEHLRTRAVKSGLSVPMFRDQQIVGALLVFTKRARHFTDEELQFLGLLAGHTAMAMRNAERQEALLRRAKHFNAAHNASRHILECFGDEQGVFDQIVREAVESVTGVSAPKAIYGTLQLYDDAQNQLVMRSIYPPESRAQILASVGEGRWTLDRAQARNGRIGVTGRTILLGGSQLVGDLSQDPDYIRYNPSSQSELSVPLRLGLQQRPVGTINVESDELNAFDEDDRSALEALADHAVIAMQIAKTHRELRETKGLVGTRTALAWMGMANNAWRHTIAGDAAELANRVTLLRELLKESVHPRERIAHHLTHILGLAKSIQEKPLTLPLSSEEGVTPTNLNELAIERLRQLRQSDRYSGVELVSEVQPGPAPLVMVSSEWLRRVLDILIDNGVRAVRSLSASSRWRVTLSIERVGATVELRVRDGGPGIPPEVLAKLFTSKIASAKGQGVGLLIAQAIVETYHGKIAARNLPTGGAEFVIQLPLTS